MILLRTIRAEKARAARSGDWIQIGALSQTPPH
ncbi:Uncharacterised protein [Legionella sainthelensi]|nr:Uncharacterised protein [Legionella sainthelensi]